MPKSAHPDFPSMRWHPETGVPEVFHAPHEVPEGYLDRHPSSFTKDEAKPAADKPDGSKASPLPMSKAQIVAALTAGNVEFKANSSAAALYELLDSNLRAHLTANNIPIPEGANVPALLALANPKNE